MRAVRPMAALAGTVAMAMALASAPCSAAGVVAKPLTLELYNVTLQQAFGELARSCGLTFDFGDGVRTDRRMSLFLKDAEPESVLYYALRANNLAMLPPREGRALLVLAEDTDDAPTVAIGTSSMLIEVNKDEADVRQQRARLQPPSAAAPAAAAAAAAAASAAASAAQPAGTLLDWKIRPRSRVGSNFTVQLFLRSDREVDAVPLTVSFDGQALEVVRVEAGSYWGPLSSLGSRVDPGGSIALEAAHPEGAGTGGRAAGQPGLLASITFRAAAAAPAAHIQIVAARALDSKGKDVGVAVPLRHAMQVQP